MSYTYPVDPTDDLSFGGLLPSSGQSFNNENVILRIQQKLTDIDNQLGQIRSGNLQGSSPQDIGQNPDQTGVAQGTPLNNNLAQEFLEIKARNLRAILGYMLSNQNQSGR